jgi:hypothetical protein
MEESKPVSVSISIIIISIIISLFTILIIYIYFKGESFKSYPCYFNIFFCIAITLDNLLRLIQNTDLTAWCWIQALSLSLLDKIILNSITIYSIIHFLGIHYQRFYEKNLKGIYITLIIINISISLLLTLIFAFKDNLSKGSEVCYVNTNNDLKIILDTIYTILLLLIDILCISSIIYGVCRLSRNYKESQDALKMSASRKYVCRFIIDLLINIITFGYILLLINKKLEFIPKEHKYIKDIIYIVLCLIIELFFTINSELFKELMRLITCNRVQRFRREERTEEETLSEAEDVENEDNY